ncbi:hypothetical protein V3C99_010625 [Haemonchus contortus]
MEVFFSKCIISAKDVKTNRTTIADCLNNKGPIKEGPAVCHKNYGHIICACSTKDRCNDPASSLSDFKNLIRSLRWKLISSPWTAKQISFQSNADDDDHRFFNDYNCLCDEFIKLPFS